MAKWEVVLNVFMDSSVSKRWSFYKLNFYIIVLNKKKTSLQILTYLG